MVIDTTVSVAALLGGLLGAAITALSNYYINRKLAAKKRLEEERRLSHVHFIRLTELAASQLVVQDLLEKALGDLPDVQEIEPGKDFEVSHGIAVMVGEILRGRAKELSAEFQVIAPFLRAKAADLKSVQLSPGELAALPDDTVYFYVRYARFVKEVQESLLYLSSLMESERLDAFDSGQIHSVWVSAQNMWSAAGVLRAALVRFGGLSSEYSEKTLVRAFNSLREEVINRLSDNAKLKDALESLRESGTLTGDEGAKGAEADRGQA